MINKTYIGIDPGKESYIVEITPEGEIVFNQIPMIGEEIDVRGLNEIFLNISLHSADIQAVIENVHAIFGASAKSTFSFGKTVGVLESLLVAHDIPFTKVQPKTWQKEMWEGVPNMKHPSSTGLTAVNDTKGMSEIAAKRLFPKIDLKRTPRCKVSDQNKVDALLIAEFCRRKFK